MQNNNTAGLQISGTTTQLEQVLSHLRISPTTEHNPKCQLCEKPLTEGDQVRLYLYKPAGNARYTIGQSRCRDHNNDALTSLFTLGVRELVVDGRVGQCRDHTTQQAWPVLLAPSVRLLSASDTTSGRVVSDSSDIHPNAPRHRRSTDADSNNRDVTSTPQTTPSSPNRDSSIAATEPPTAVERGDNEC